MESVKGYFPVEVFELIWMKQESELLTDLK